MREGGEKREGERESSMDDLSLRDAYVYIEEQTYVYLSIYIYVSTIFTITHICSKSSKSHAPTWNE